MGISAALGSSALLPAGLGFRNVLINGNMSVYQRNASSTTSSASGFACDRWNNFRGGGASGLTVSRQTAGLTGFQYCSRIQRDSGNTGTAAFYFVQNIETVNSIPLAGKQVYLSFWARAGANFSSSSSVLRSSVEYATSTDQNYYTIGDGASTTVVSQNNTLTTSWQYFTMPATIAASQTQVFVAFKFTPTGTAGAADYFEITGVQLEQNYQPTPFEQRPYGIELMLCQRYYYKSTTNPSTEVGVGMIYGTNQAITINKFPVPMRIAPTSATFTGLTAGIDSGGTGRGFGSNTFNASTTEDVSIAHSGGFNFTMGAACYVYAQAGGWNFAVSAEL